MRLYAQETFHINYSKKTGLPSNTVYYSMQDSNGFMWFGTDAGLCRYDGHGFTTYTPQQGLSDNEVFQLMEDSEKRIWCLTYNGKISYYKNGTFYNSTTDTTLRNLDANDIYSCAVEDHEKRIWLTATSRGVFILHTDGTTDHIKINKPLYHLWEYEDEMLGLSFAGIFHFEKNNPHEFTFDEIPGLNINSDGSRKAFIDYATDTVYYPSLAEGVYAINFKTNRFKHTMVDKSIMGLQYATANLKWVYHATGAFLWTGEDKVSEKLELKGSIVAHVTQDLESGFWFSTLNNGVFYIPSLKIKHLKSKDGLTDDDIRRIIQKPNGDMLAFEERGAYSIISSADHAIKNFPSALPAGNVRLDEVQTNGDTLWVVGKSTGLVKIFNNKTESFFPNGTIKSFSIDTDKVWLAGGYKGLVEIKRSEFYRGNKTYSQKKFEPQPVSYNIRCFYLHRLPDRSVLLGTSNGLCVYKDGVVENLSGIHPYLQKRITSIEQASDGTLWIIVDGTAVVVLNSNFEFIDVIDASAGINKETCNRLFVDDNNEAWVITNHSLYNARLENKKVKLTTVFTLEAENLNDIIADQENVWLASSGGILMLPRTFEHEREIHTHFTEIYVNAKRIDPSIEKLVVPYNENNFRIRFAAISFNTKNILYRYKTNKKQTDWTVTESNDLEFSSLSPGEYSFQIQVKSSNENWSDHTAVFNLIIEQPFWERWWFIGGVLTIVVLIVIIIVQSIYRSNYKKLELNDRLVESELKALVAQMNPHFIFNTLNTIQKFFITYDTKIANRLLSRFSTLMRMILDNTSKSFISIEDEVAFLQTYLEIEKMRFNQNFEYQITVDKTIDPSAVMIPSMTLQPFIENAIIHGIMPRKEAGKISLSFQHRDDYTYVVIEDNGVGRNQDQNKVRTHIPKGINLIKERLDILSIKNKKSYRVEIVDLHNPTGTKVEIYL
jgi:ligand-binding sensor domain-containing protein